MCLGTFSRLARSLATVYIFARVRIFGTSVPFSDLPSFPSPTHSAGESSGTDALCREPGFLLAHGRMRWRTDGTCLSVSELCRLFSAFSILLQAERNRSRTPASAPEDSPARTPANLYFPQISRISPQISSAVFPSVATFTSAAASYFGLRFSISSSIYPTFIFPFSTGLSVLSFTRS